jgi:signal transduction histidine kinase
MEIVLRNLIDNAVKYSNDHLEITVDAQIDAPRKRAVITVRDHGIGIDQADLRRVFNRFFRVASEAVRKRKGTGLGLFVVSALLRNVGGTVSAGSAGEGQGTTFTVWLPLRRADA